MAKHTSDGPIDGISVELTTEGPESQEDPDGIGSDALHLRLVEAIEGVRADVEGDSE